MNSEIYLNENSWGLYRSNSSESERLTFLINRLLEIGVIKTNKEFGEKIGESSAGLNDLKKGRKKISTKHVGCMKESYPFVNVKFLLSGTGDIYHKEYIKETVNHNVIRHYEDIDKITNSLSLQEKQIDDFIQIDNSLVLYSKLVKVQNQLIDAQIEILKLKNELHKFEK